MSFRGYMLLAAGLVFGGALFSQAQKDNGGGDRKPVEFMAADIYSDQKLNQSLGIDERATILVGDVIFHHNGTIISCDSAVRYFAANRIECFSASGLNDIIINKDSTFIYCNKVEYNGEANLARVYSPVIKVIDGESTLYTYNFTFNTKDNIGRWFGGGVVYQQDNTMESEAGYFYSDLHELVAVGDVQMKNDSHQLVSDSVRYNTETKIATFYTRTWVWTKKGEMVSALKGRYNTQDSTYFFHDNAYVLDEFRETWADTIDFNARFENAVFYGNIQMDDREHNSSAFGDLAHYWGERGETRLTRRPSLLNYDADKGNADTLYMRADTIFMYVRYPSDGKRWDSLSGGGYETDRFAHLKWVDSLPDSLRTSMADSLVPVIAKLFGRIDDMRRHADSIMNALYPSVPAEASPAPGVTDTLPLPDSLFAHSGLPSSDSLHAPIVPAAPTVEPERIEPPEVTEIRARMARLTAEADSLKAAEGYIRPRRQGGGIDSVPVDSLARLRVDSLARIDSLVRIDSIRIADPKAYKILRKAEAKREKTRKQRLAAERREAKFAAKAAARAEKQRLRAEKRAAKAAAKAASTAKRRRLARQDIVALDSLLRTDSLARLDSIAELDSLRRLDSLAGFKALPSRDSTATADTTLRIFRGWHNVKIWRKDMQAVSDSLVGFSLDSTVHMYKDPILWHGDNQVTADSIVLYTAGQKIEHAEFYGEPIMGSQIGNELARQFNQVKGRRMTSWFRDGELYRHDTYENAQAYYYMQEEEKGSNGQTVMSDAMAFLVSTAESISFLFENDSLRYIVERNNVPYTVFPMDQIPGTQSTQMQGFVWNIDRQPSLGEVFDRRVRPSERAAYEALARPEFPIAAMIDRRREYLISNRMWADRSDPLPAHAIEFRRDRYREAGTPATD